MAAPKRGPRFGQDPEHHNHIIRGLAVQLFENGGITTTLPKAKALRPYAERMISKAKKGGMHQHRQLVSRLHDKDVAQTLISEIGPRYSDRNGGYTRILKLGPRQGDAAPMARIELV